MLYSLNQLNAQQLEELRQLGTECKKIDGSLPNVYPHILEQPRALPGSLLYYEQEQLLGFLGAYFFYDTAVEIGLLINPSHRKRGIGKQLLFALLPLIQSQHYNTLIFSCPAQLNNAWLSATGFSYLHSEYAMERNNLTPILECKSSLTFRNATLNDISLLLTMDSLCFPIRLGKPEERLHYLIESNEYQICLAYQNNQPIGKAHLRWHTKGATISDIAIIPAQQGKGLGTALISYCINLALSEGKPQLNLDVETHNQRALKLYTRLGFFIQNACDYWSININQLLK